MVTISDEFESALDALYAADPFDGSKRHSAILTGEETPFFAGLPENPRLYGIAEELYGDCFPITSDANRYVGDSRWHPDHYIDVEKDCYGIKFAYYLDPVGPESGSPAGDPRLPPQPVLDRGRQRQHPRGGDPRGALPRLRVAAGGPGRVRRAPVARQLRRRRGQAHVHCRLLQESADSGRGEGDALAGRALRRCPRPEAVRQPPLGGEIPETAGSAPAGSSSSSAGASWPRRGPGGNGRRSPSAPTEGAAPSVRDPP